MGNPELEPVPGEVPGSGAVDAPANPHFHYWSFCERCKGPTVICGKCGNNCCNGGYGILADDSRCDGCPSAYAMQVSGYPEGYEYPVAYWDPPLFHF